MVSNISSTPGKRSLIPLMTRCASASSKYMKSPWAVMKTPCDPAVHPGEIDSAQGQMATAIGRLQEPFAHGDGVRQIDAQPLHPAVVAALKPPAPDERPVDGAGIVGVQSQFRQDVVHRHIRRELRHRRRYRQHHGTDEPLLLCPRYLDEAQQAGFPLFPFHGRILAPCRLRTATWRPPRKFSVRRRLQWRLWGR
jgi:hypothetical protein